MNIGTHFFLIMPTPNPAHTVTKHEQMATAMGRPCAGWSSMVMDMLVEASKVKMYWDIFAKICGVFVCASLARLKKAGLQVTVKTRRSKNMKPLSFNFYETSQLPTHITTSRIPHMSSLAHVYKWASPVARSLSPAQRLSSTPQPFAKGAVADPMT